MINSALQNVKTAELMLISPYKLLKRGINVYSVLQSP